MSVRTLSRCLLVLCLLAAPVLAKKKNNLKVNVLSDEPPKLTVGLHPSGGGPKLPGYSVTDDGSPSKYDFEDGSTQCVVRYHTGRQCHLSWKADNADRIEISPSEWTDSGKSFSFPKSLDESGSFTFYNYQFSAGTTRNFTLTARNSAGATSRKFTIRRYSCFLPGTEVLMANGSYKKIEEIKPSDEVASYDTKDGKIVGRSVIARTERVSQDGYYIVNKDLKVTPQHLFYGNGEWTRTSELKVGDNLLNPNGEPIPIESLQIVTTPATVFNLITEEPENYFVRMGKEDVLVHNQNQGAAVPEKGLMPGTKVILADGRYVPVEKIKVGDRLLSYDRVKNRYAHITVHGTSDQQISKVLVINGKLMIGTNHPIYKVDPKSGPKLPD